MAQNDRRGGSTGQDQQNNNQQLSAAERLRFVLGQLKTRQGEIEDVLPPDIPFDHFYAVVNQSLRNNPDILKATGLSIVNACVKAAYDGLRLDGREAALVTHRVKVSRTPERWEDHAQYFPMVYGLIQQVLRGGEVIALEATIIYENDEYQVQRGTDPRIYHAPLMVGDRGKPIAVYSIATYKTGYVGFEFMTEAQVLDVRSASKSGEKDGKPIGIWARWPDAMWKKTCIRQHRKTLPIGGRDLYDSEQNDEFPALADVSSGAPSIAPPRPTRHSIQHQPGGAGEPLDFGMQFGEREGVVIDATDPAAAGEKAAIAAKAAKSAPAVDVPEDEQAWAAWSADVEADINAATTTAAVEAIRLDEAARINAATKERGDFIKSLITDRLADLASEAAGSAASAGED